MKYLFFTLILAFAISTSLQAQEKAAVVAFQERINADFKDPEESPLLPEDRKNFESLDFFDFDPDFQVKAEFVRTPYELPFQMPTTTERTPVYVKYGTLYFSLKGRDYELNVYQNQKPKPGYADYLFVPFTDQTNGEESYGGGRYLDLRSPLSGEVMLDFNTAYNPYCAYNGKYSCPIPPEENHLDLRITAGVKAFRK